MSFLSGKTDFREPDQKLSGLDERRVATNEQARPVPYFAGRRILGVTHISNLFNIVVLPRKVDVKKGEDQISGYYYHADFAAMVCHGPVDAIFAIYFDKKKVWSGAVYRGENESELITVEGYGNIRIYWGREDQTAAPDLVASGENHPPYRGQCYIFASLLFGYQKTNAPQIELELGRWPEAAFIDAPAEIDGDSNPIHFLSELAMNPRFGAGLAQSRLDTVQLNKVAQKLHAEGMGLSPLLNKQMNFREVVIETLQYFDGYHFTTKDGKFSIGLNRSLSGDIPMIREKDLLEEPEIKPAGWDTTINDLRVKYSNRDALFESASEPYINRANRQITGRPLSKTLDRSWITRTDLAARVATATGRQLGLPKAPGSIAVKKSVVADLRPGKTFWLCYCPVGVNQFCRISEIVIPDPAKPRAEIQFEIDRGYLNSDSFYIPSAEPLPEPPTYEPAPIEYDRVIELPYGLRNENYEVGVGFLAARPTLQTNALSIHRKRPSGSYEELLARQSFALRGHLVEAYTDATTLIDDQLGALVQFDGADTELPNFPLEDALLNDWLLFINGEILSLFTATLVADGRYRVYGIRGRYDTIRQSHAINSEVFAIRRKSLPAYVEPSQANPLTWKLQPFVLGAALDLAEIDPVYKNLNYRGQRPWVPKNLRVNGLRANATWNETDDVLVTWSNVSPDLTDLPSTILEIITDDTVQMTETLAPGVGSRTFDPAELISVIGFNPFTIRLWHLRPGDWKSLLSTELTVLPAV